VDPIAHVYFPFGLWKKVMLAPEDSLASFLDHDKKRFTVTRKEKIYLAIVGAEGAANAVVRLNR
jgi:hypothetical protein